jgi:hypothetical protein
MSKQRTPPEGQDMKYEADMAGLLSLRLIAAPDPKDDLSDEELTAFCQDPKHSPELIRHLIDFVKAI